MISKGAYIFAEGMFSDDHIDAHHASLRGTAQTDAARQLATEMQIRLDNEASFHDPPCARTKYTPPKLSHEKIESTNLNKESYTQCRFKATHRCINST